MKNNIKRGGTLVCLVILILIMTFFEGSYGMAGMIYNGLTSVILVLLGAHIISDFYCFFKEIEAILITPRLLIIGIISIASLLYGMQGVWTTGWDLKDGPVSFEVHPEDVTVEEDTNILHFGDSVYAVIDHGNSMSRLIMTRKDVNQIMNVHPDETVTVSYWMHSKKVNHIIKSISDEADLTL